MHVRTIISIILLVIVNVVPLGQFARAELYQQPVRQTQATSDPRLAGLVQDVEELRYRVGQMRLDNESLKKDIAELKRSLVFVQNEQKKLVVTIKEMEKEWKALNEAQRKDIITQVSQQIQKLAAQTQAAIDGLSQQVSKKSDRKGGMAATYAKEGFEYTVQPGDTLSKIADKYNSNVNELQVANEIGNPRGLRSGEKIFIPQKN
ncbi:MAG: hypothetical protein COY94_08290 [Verrucomicrobia bacterium CG_4_10_14_0_8_um_filter_43_34]|nr:MAG: hypothetical protein COX01_00010 [Verrucomicrobia bacterium CG22_combo_CG10-13_8_21_14_all_43_17]PIY60875.1 MAG: hypothetical protein COY94_08290 [Verrucomicrobia bacterium CG_4_10_14_0_8_um_filter_43_34]